MPAGGSPASDPDVSGLPTGKSSGSSSAQSARQPRSKVDATLSDTQALRLLEERGAGPMVADGEAIGAVINVVHPENTRTMLVLREPVALSAPVSFAVQLQWSVHPIDVKSIQQHSIFASYTLYAAEGRRDGRAWFFLRLGFFRDAVSARQVALYLRSQFPSAAVVPVGEQEQEHAMRVGRGSAAATRRSS